MKRGGCLARQPPEGRERLDVVVQVKLPGVRSQRDLLVFPYALEADHAYLTKGGVFTTDLIETWIRSVVKTPPLVR